MSQKKKEAVLQKKTVEEISTEEENLKLIKQANETKVSNWLLVIGIGAAVAVGTAATVYYYKRRKSKLAWEDESEGYSIDYYKKSFNRYWALTKKTFDAVTVSVNEFFAKNKNQSPLTSGDDSYLGGPFMGTDTSDHEEIVLCEL